VNTSAKLASFAAVVVVSFGAAAAVGAGVGPIGDVSTDHRAMNVASESAATSSGLPRGLAVADGGYRLVAERTDIAANATSTFGFSIVDDVDDGGGGGGGGGTLTEFDALHERRLHLIVVSRNLVDFHHLHPDMDVSGRWTVDLPSLAPGSYRVFADFRPEGGGDLTLGTDVTVVGDVAAVAIPDPTNTFDVDGYTVTLAGTPSVGDTELSFTVELDGEVVTTEPYLGAAGHLVAIRVGDLAYLHVHPHETTSPDSSHTTSPQVAFTSEFPTAGTYRLFLDFSHDGVVRTAAFTVTVPDGDGTVHQAGTVQDGH
jgi:hypothetical protein